MSQSKNHPLYEKLSRIYEWAFKPFFLPGIIRALKIIEHSGAHEFLEVGVGTGYSLSHYPKNSTIIGLDVSAQMLEMSSYKAAQISDKSIKILSVTDFEKKYQDQTFMTITSFSVITVVPTPQDFLNQLNKYLAPGGTLYLIMHKRGSGLSLLIDRIFDWPCRLLFGFTLLRQLEDYQLNGLVQEDCQRLSHFLFYPYNHIYTLKKPL